MKTSFAKEKSEYSWLMWENIENLKLTESDRKKNLTRIKEIEKEIKKQGDKIIVIVTTENTNPLKGKVAPPMSMEKIKQKELINAY